jgi:hypothetical protein
MYEFSRAIYRELADDIIEDTWSAGPNANRARVLRSCEEVMDRLVSDRHYFANPARTLFREIRPYFPMTSQMRVLRLVERYIAIADEHVSSLPLNGVDANGNPMQCRASTRKGTPCQRMPLPHNGYCPSHQHLADTEDAPARVAA